MGIHDIGGLDEEFGPIDTREFGYQLWEMKVRVVYEYNTEARIWIKKN